MTLCTLKINKFILQFSTDTSIFYFFSLYTSYNLYAMSMYALNVFNTVNKSINEGNLFL